MSARDRLLFLFCNKKFTPNPSYLHFGEFPRSWDTKNRSSHTQIVHIEILRAQMYLKSDETEGTPPSEHMDIFAKNRFWVPRGVWEAQCVKTIVFLSVKVARVAISRRRDDSKCHQVRSLRIKIDRRTVRRMVLTPTGSLSRPSEPYSDKSV